MLAITVGLNEVRSHKRTSQSFATKRVWSLSKSVIALLLKVLISQMSFLVTRSNLWIDGPIAARKKASPGSLLICNLSITSSVLRLNYLSSHICTLRLLLTPVNGVNDIIFPVFGLTY